VIAHSGKSLAMKTRKRITKRNQKPLAAAMAVLALGLMAFAGLLSPGSAKAGHASFADCARSGDQHRALWHPRATTEPWQWQLQGKINTHVPACVYDVDGFETSKKTVAQLHREHVKVICYIDVGSWEPYRPDKAEFPRSVIGRRYAGFENERWLDVAHFHRFEKPMKQRFAMCARKGFDAVEPDNIAGWEKENHTGFKITRSDQLRYNRWVAHQVHARGMSVALKNDGRQAQELSPDFDFAVVEECFQYDECGYYKNTFIKEGKAVFETEYEQQPKEYCRTAKAIEFSSIRKSYDLFAKPWIPCRYLGPRH
jgi:endo-alpha-1,4-polygalactosaminidase (GH114 family)